MKRILIVEDDPFILDVYSAHLRQEGYNVDVAKDGQLALEKIKKNRPDLVMLDIQLPKLDGCQVIKRIKADESTKNLKIITISNFCKEDYPEDISEFKDIKCLVKVETPIEEIVKYVKEELR